MVTSTTRFGEVSYEEDDCIHVVDGMLGFPEHQRYVLVQHREGSPFRWLQSLDDAALAFLLVSPAELLTDYGPTVPEDQTKALALSADDPILVYVVVTIPPGNPQDMTVNLSGPIIINPRNRMARQVVVDDVCYVTKHRVIGEAKEPAKSAA